MDTRSDAPQIRELFIDELAGVNGGGPVEDLLAKITPEINKPPWATTMACCEEGSDGCCA